MAVLAVGALDVRLLTENGVVHAVRGIDFSVAVVRARFTYAAADARIMRSSMHEVANENWVVLARAEGLRRREVVGRHVVRAALQPAVTMPRMDILRAECSLRLSRSPWQTTWAKSPTRSWTLHRVQ